MGSSTHPAPPIKKGLKNRPVFIGGEGGIRTHVPELPDHPISSRRRCDHFGTSPVNLKTLLVYLIFWRITYTKFSFETVVSPARNAFVKGSRKEIIVYSSASEKGSPLDKELALHHGIKWTIKPCVD